MDEVLIKAGGINLAGVLKIPKHPKGLVIFAHGSGSSRLSPRNNYVADALRKHGLATLLFDLLTEEEDRVYANRFDIQLLAERLVAATAWARGQPAAKGLKIGYFGSSTGSAAALIAAAKRGNKIDAVVSRGGRPDMALSVLSRLKSPTLLIVGAADYGVIELNEQAYMHMRCEKEMVLIPEAAHLFEEPGTLEEVAKLASRWFKDHLR